jgi:enamine deaminase RidA (YjgF/YER057c/UK114 family)
MDRLVKVNAFAESLETIDQFRKQLASRLDASVRPAVCAVISPLPLSGARIAVDVVAAADSQDEAVVLRQSEAVVSHAQCADVAVMPKGGVVYLSGQPDKSPLAEATVKSMSTLLDVIHQLELQPAQIVQLKVFIDSASAAGTVISELKKLLPGQMLPPVTFVEWIASAPIEIEVVMHLPTDSWHGGETLRFYTPTGVQPSPTFSKVAVLETDRQIYVSGLSAAAAGGAESQVQDVFRQLQQVLSASGSDLTHLAKATYYVSDKDASDALNKLRPEYYDPERPPAASKAMVHGVDQAGRTVTIDMIAVAGDDQDLSGSQENSP